MIKKLQNSSFVKVLACAFACLPIIFLFYLLNLFGLNFPYGWDDFLVMNVILDFENASSFFDKIKIMFSPHNEHNIAYVHFITWLIYKVGGSINFRTMMFIGNLGLVIWALHHIYVIYQKEKKLWWALPVTFLIFQVQLEANFYWGMSSLQNHSVLAWVSLAIYFSAIADKRSTYFWFLFFGLLATFTSAGGMPSLMVGIIILIYRRHYKWAIGAISVLIPCILLYQYNYKQYFASESFTGNALLHPLGQFLSIFIVFGDIVDLRQYVSVRDIVFGFIIFIWAIYGLILLILPQNWYQKLIKNPFLGFILKPYDSIQKDKKLNLFYAGCLCFVIMTTLLIAVRRFYMHNWVDAVLGIPLLSARYHFHSIMAVLSIYGLFIGCFRQRSKIIFSSLFLGLGLFTNIFSFFHLTNNIYTHHQMLRADYTNIIKNDFSIMGYGKNWFYPAAQKSLNRAKTQKIYDVTAPIKNLNTPIEKNGSMFGISSITYSGSELAITSDTLNLNFWDPDKTLFVEIYTPTQTVRLPVTPNLNSKKNIILGKIYRNGFAVTIPKYLLDTQQTYKIRVLDYSAVKSCFYNTSAEFNIEKQYFSTNYRNH